ncbi:MAG: GtrA family protein [Spirochaetales bacterium]|nr:GtrA family protein [Spirochaetales bacterium]
MKGRGLSRGIPQGFRQFIKFNIVGVINTAIDFAVFTLLNLAGVFYLAAQVVSYFCGLVNSYILNRFWTFAHRGKFDALQALKFLGVNLAALGTSLAVLYLLKDVFGFTVLTGKLVSTGFSLIVNFCGNRWWVFNKKPA